MAKNGDVWRNSYSELIRAILFLANQEKLDSVKAQHYSVPAISSLFPFRVADINKCRTELKFVEQFFQLFPYLLRPQRVYNFSTEYHVGTKYLFSLEKLIRRDRLNGNFLVQTEKQRALDNINSDKFPLVVSSSEYLVNLNGLARAIKRLYKGEKISTENWILGAEVVVGKLFEITPKRQQPGHFYFYDKDFQFHVLKIEEHSFFVPYVLNGGVDYLLEILDDLGFIVPESEIRSVYLDEQKNSLLNSPFNFFQTVKDENKANGFSMSNLKQFIQSNAHDHRIEGNYNRVFDWCDEYFDEAKQTGIEYSNFQELFFIYGPELQQMNEKAYELMNESRDTEAIWKKVVQMFE